MNWCPKKSMEKLDEMHNLKDRPKNEFSPDL